MSAEELLKLAEKFEKKIAQDARGIPQIPPSSNPKTKAVFDNATHLFAILKYWLETNNFKPGMSYEEFNKLLTSEHFVMDLKQSAPELQLAFSNLMAALK